MRFLTDDDIGRLIRTAAEKKSDPYVDIARVMFELDLSAEVTAEQRLWAKRQCYYLIYSNSNVLH